MSWIGVADTLNTLFIRKIVVADVLKYFWRTVLTTFFANYQPASNVARSSMLRFKLRQNWHYATRYFMQFSRTKNHQILHSVVTSKNEH